jgi:hypothetical protein
MNKTHIKFGKALKPEKPTARAQKRTEEFNEALMLYFGGYATHKGYTPESWFAARDHVNVNKRLIPKFGQQ